MFVICLEIIIHCSFIILSGGSNAPPFHIIKARRIPRQISNDRQTIEQIAEVEDLDNHWVKNIKKLKRS